MKVQKLKTLFLDKNNQFTLGGIPFGYDTGLDLSTSRMAGHLLANGDAVVDVDNGTQILITANTIVAAVLDEPIDVTAKGPGRPRKDA